MKKRKDSREVRSDFFTYFRFPSSTEVFQHGAAVVWQSARSVPHIPLKFARPTGAKHTKTPPTNQSSLLPWSACCVECFLVRCLLCPLALLGEALGSKSRPLVWRWSGKACTQLARAGVHRQRRRERERGRETDRDKETETETETETEADRQAGRQSGGRGTAVRQIRG